MAINSTNVIHELDSWHVRRTGRLFCKNGVKSSFVSDLIASEHHTAIVIAFLWGKLAVLFVAEVHDCAKMAGSVLFAGFSDDFGFRSDFSQIPSWYSL